MNPINYIQNWWQDFQNDPKWKTKLIFFVSTGLIGIILVFVVIQLNTINPDNAGNNPPKDNTVTQNVVTTKSFEDATSLEKVSDEPIGMPNQVVFATGGRVASLDKDMKLRLNNQTLANSPSFAARQISFSGNSIIVNEDYRTTVWSEAAGFRILGDGSFALTPVLLPDSLGLLSQPAFLYFTKADNGYSLKRADDIDLSKGVSTIAQVQPGQNMQSLEIRVLNRVPYLILYETISRQGIMEIFKIEGAGLKRIATISKVQSVRFGPRQVMITTLLDTPTELTPYSNLLIDFANTSDGQTTVLDLEQRLGQNNSFGSVVAERCAFGLGQDLYCLTKQRKVSKNEASEVDTLSRFDYQAKSLEFPFSSLAISGHSVGVASNGQIYIIGQVNNLLYRIK